MSQENIKNLSEPFIQAFDELASKIFKQGETPQQALGVSPQILENVYAQAYRLYQTGKYLEAVHLFRMLMMFNAMEPKYTFGLAACFHMLKDYSQAIQLYTMYSALDPQNPIPHYHAADCFIQMQDHLSAMVCLQLTIDRMSERPEYAKIKERAQLTLESLKKQFSSKSTSPTPASPLEKPEIK
jgi:type III secretion system low calcium response chaperone LcrH/SycD